MNNFYHKVAVAYVGITLGFALGATKEAKAATFTLPSTTTFQVIDYDFPGLFKYDGLGDVFSQTDNEVVASCAGANS